MSILQKLKERFPALHEGELLKNHCTFRVGGKANLFYELKNIEELPALITLMEESEIPYKIIGRGTNVLFTDKGFRGIIIKNLTSGLRVEGDFITADSGVLLSQIVRASVENHLTGLEPLYGLPGSIGGAVHGNAGIPNTEIGSFVREVTLFNVGDGVRAVAAEEISFRYRASSIQESRDLIMQVKLELKKGNSEHSKDLMKRVDEIRRGKQPMGFTAGSFFKNPSREQPAGFLIDQVGLKGYAINDAKISEKHANFFMNAGHAKFSELLALAKLAQQKVKEKFGIELEIEVKIIGDL